MDKVTIIYWSQSGNTEAMANAIADGVKEAGKEAELLTVSEASVDTIKDVAGFAIGCPAMGAEVLEEAEMEPYMADIEGSISGKTIALFGSYGWGDGEWMRDWTERCTNAGATVVDGEGVICNDAPDDDTIAKLKAVGAKLAAL